MPSPGQRAAAELARDPRRIDALIADAARCTPRTVLRARRVLERRGQIQPVPAIARAGWTLPSRNPGAYARAAQQLALDPARSTRDLAQAAACSDQTVLVARRAARPHNGSVGNQFTSKLRVMPGDPHASRAMQDPHNREPALYHDRPDSIELECPGCTLIWAGGTWTHDPGCALRSARL